jgi:hypothetical protein
VTGAADRAYSRIGYVAEIAETALREVLADLRPKAAAIRRYVERFGSDAADDVSAMPVTASWRQHHVLVEMHAVLDGPLIDLCDADVRYQVELEHAALLDAHGMDHLALSQITPDTRPLTNACVVLFEGRGGLAIVAEPVALTDPAPPAP